MIVIQMYPVCKRYKATQCYYNYHHMSEWNDKTPEQISEQEYKVTPISFDKVLIDKLRTEQKAIDEHYEMTHESSDRRRVKEKQENTITEELEKEKN